MRRETTVVLFASLLAVLQAATMPGGYRPWGGYAPNPPSEDNGLHKREAGVQFQYTDPAGLHKREAEGGSDGSGIGKRSACCREHKRSAEAGNEPTFAMGLHKREAKAGNEPTFAMGLHKREAKAGNEPTFAMGLHKREAKMAENNAEQREKRSPGKSYVADVKYKTPPGKLHD